MSFKGLRRLTLTYEKIVQFCKLLKRNNISKKRNKINVHHVS